MNKNILMMSAALVLATGICDFAFAANQCKRVEAFYPTWRTSTFPINSINWNALHGLKVAFAFPTESGGLSTAEVDAVPLSTLVSTAHANNTRVILSIGGAGVDPARSSAPFLAMVNAANTAHGGRQARLNNFATAVKNYVVANNIDGVDIDWENWSGAGGAEVPAEGQGLVDLLAVLRDTLPPTVSLSADVLTGSWNGGNYLAAMTQHTDYIHLMTYDYTGQWSSSPIGHHASMADTNSFTAAEKTKYAGEPLMLGMPYYGKEFAGGANTTVNTWIHKDIVARAQQQGININAGMIQGPSGPIYYETPDLAKQKASKVFGDSQLIGLFSWELSQDTTSASTSLLSAVSTVLNKCSNGSPTANAGADRTVNKGDTVNLSVTGSDPEGDQLTYYWEQVSGSPSVTINNKRTRTPSVNIPSTAAGATLTFKASVCDTSQACGSDTVVVNVNPDGANRAPVVNASNVTVTSGQVAHLTATATDPDGDAMTYSWSPAAGLTGANTLNTSFTAPTVTVSTTLNYTITVCDNKALCTSKPVVVTINPVTTNRAPVVNAANVTVSSGQLVNLTATATDADAMTYSWTPAAGVTGATTLNASFTAPSVTVTTTLNYTITACDTKNACGSKVVVVTVNPLNTNCAPAYQAYPKMYYVGDLLSYQGRNYKALEGPLWNIPPTMAGQSHRYQDLGVCN